ncbi:MAG TPA: YicC family protein [Clostridiaceae bacterium]|nr:YicC family protein [Clostridiaceae bacterium]
MGYSMTGFGRGESVQEERRVTVEISSVNSRYSDLHFRLPRQLAQQEPALRELIKKSISRGKIDVRVEWEDFDGSDSQVSLDKNLAQSYLQAYEALEDLTDRHLPDVISLLAQTPELFRMHRGEGDVEGFWSQIEEATDAALDQLISMRKREGDQLTTDIRYKIEQMTEQLALVAKRAQVVPQEQKERLERRVEELLGQSAEEYYDGQRVAAEIAIFADKASIDEELVRLDSHLRQMDLILDEDNPIGKQLDFLCQEINREINTIGSKSSDLEITGQVVQMKTTLEKIREQVQNLE